MSVGNLIEAYDLYEIPPAFMVSLSTKPVRAYYRSRTHSKLIVIDKENGGKADALNAAVNASRYPSVCAIDADAILEDDALPGIGHACGHNISATAGLGAGQGPRVVGPFPEPLGDDEGLGGGHRTALVPMSWTSPSPGTRIGAPPASEIRTPVGCDHAAAPSATASVMPP